MTLEFDVAGQSITRTPSNMMVKVVADSHNQIGVKFNFSEDWTGIAKTAIVTTAFTTYHVAIVDDEIIPENMPILREGMATISVFGGDLFTANVKQILVEASGMKPGITPPVPTPDIYTQLLNSVVAERAECQRLIDLLTNGLTPVGNSEKLGGQLPSYYAKESERTPRNSTFTIVSSDTIKKDGADYICSDTAGKRFNDVIAAIMTTISNNALLQGSKIYIRNGTYFTNGDINISQKCILEFEDEFDTTGEQSLTTNWNFTATGIYIYNGE